jgi:hypothetical protein
MQTKSFLSILTQPCPLDHRVTSWKLSRVLCKDSVSRGLALLKPALFGARQSRLQRLHKSIQIRHGCASFYPVRSQSLLAKSALLRVRNGNACSHVLVSSSDAMHIRFQRTPRNAFCIRSLIQSAYAYPASLCNHESVQCSFLKLPFHPRCVARRSKSLLRLLPGSYVKLMSAEI